MARSLRHRAIASPSPPAPIYTILRDAPAGHVCQPPCFRPALANRSLHSVVREPLLPESTERGEPRAMADKRRGAPVGQSVATHSFVVVQRTDRVSDKQPRPQLGAVDDASHLRGLSLLAVWVGLGLACWGIVAALVILAYIGLRAYGVAQ